MKIIAHRGNLNGPSQFENQPRTLLKAIELGFDVECDVRFYAGRLWLGHDNADYLVSNELLEKLIPHAWFHCKDIGSLEFFADKFLVFPNYFYHDNDEYVVTSHGHIWASPGRVGGENTILVLPEKSGIIVTENSYGICTDYPIKYSKSV